MADSKSGSPVSYSSFLVTTCLSRLVLEIFAFDRQTDRRTANADHYYSWLNIVASQLINVLFNHHMWDSMVTYLQTLVHKWIHHHCHVSSIYLKHQHCKLHWTLTNAVAIQAQTNITAGSWPDFLAASGKQVLKQGLIWLQSFAVWKVQSPGPAELPVRESGSKDCHQLHTTTCTGMSLSCDRHDWQSRKLFKQITNGSGHCLHTCCQQLLVVFDVL